jgi:hypothetical protein
MSATNPGGSRHTTGHRIYGAENIRRAQQQRKLDHAAGAETSLATGNRAGGGHGNERAIARRLRQQERAK